MEIIMATGNKNKVREISEMLEGSSLHVTSMKDAGIDVEIIEDGKSFEENAVIKARTVCEAAKKLGREALVIADDSGLVIDALNGEPGIYSARYMGEDTSYDIKNAELIRRLEGVPEEKRTARFVCAMAIAYPDGTDKVFTGNFDGHIAHQPAGTNGFGYDPILYLPEYGCTSAELSSEQKNAISHRGKALKLAVEELLKG